MTTTEHAFDVGTALEPLGGGRYRGRVDEDWWIDKGPNGGYLAAVVLRGLMLEVNDAARLPRSLSVHYVARPVEGVVEVAAVLERVGRSTTATTGRLTQDGELLATAQAVFSAARNGPSFDDDPAPATPPPEEIPELEVPKEMFPRFAWNFDYRWAIGSLPYSAAERALSGGWIRPKSPRPLDPLLVATYADGWPPSLFARLQTPAAVPTIDLTIHFRAPGELAHAPDWTLVSFETKVAAGGFIEEDGRIWDRNGVLLAQSRQLALYQDPR
ncbi:MAG: acyl-CoA thioesterase [Actinomycetota bacterium]